MLVRQCAVYNNRRDKCYPLYRYNVATSVRIGGLRPMILEEGLPIRIFYRKKMMTSQKYAWVNAYVYMHLQVLSNIFMA